MGFWGPTTAITDILSGGCCWVEGVEGCWTIVGGPPWVRRLLPDVAVEEEEEEAPMREFLALGFRYSLSEDFVVVTGVAGAAGGAVAGNKNRLTCKTMQQ